jgi:hypothetical protein
MKNLYTKNEFLTLRNDDILNEGLVTGLFKGLFNSVAKLANKIKGTKEIDKIFNQYKGFIDQAFAKLGNVGTAEQAATAATTPTTKQNKQQPISGTTQQNASFGYNSFDILNEVETAPTTPSAKATVKNQEKQNTTEQKNLVNLTPQKIAELTKITQNRIEELRKQFEVAIDAVITKLTKNPNYSSDKLNQYAMVQKNAFMTYVYDQWYGFYQKVGDQKRLTELVKVKKENEAKYKQSIAELNTKLGEKQKKVDVVTAGNYIYHNTKGKDITVTVIGKELGKDENGNNDATDPKHNGMWKVKSGDASFWISPESFKAKATETTTVAPATTETTTVAPATTTETTTVAL